MTFIFQCLLLDHMTQGGSHMTITWHADSLSGCLGDWRLVQSPVVYSAPSAVGKVTWQSHDHTAGSRDLTCCLCPFRMTILNFILSSPSSWTNGSVDHMMTTVSKSCCQGQQAPPLTWLFSGLSSHQSDRHTHIDCRHLHPLLPPLLYLSAIKNSNSYIIVKNSKLHHS